MEYRIFNDWKKKLWSANEAETFENLLEDFKTWYKGQTFRNDEEKELFNQQIVDLKEKKTNFYNKQKSHPQVVKNSYIFREEEGKAIIALCNTVTELLKIKIRKQPK